MLSVVIRTKNQEKALAFLLKDLRERYADDVAEIIVLDNLSTDASRKVSEHYNARFVTVEKFSYGESANIAAAEAAHDIVVIFSAHAFPVSHDFFKLIIEKFKGREDELAGLRCIHTSHDYIAYINGVSGSDDYNKAGLMFAGSAFNKRVWKKHPFKSDVTTFEDKEWSKRVLREGYKIEFVPSIFCYDIKRSKKQIFFREKNEIIGSYQLHHTEYTFSKTIKNVVVTWYSLTKKYITDLYYLARKVIFMVGFLLNKPEQYK
jgi:glycosyltransferase involved in cell wall biosynthesis